jgi:four helix bundle protein
MATIQKFEDLKVWQKARLLCKEVFSLTSIANFSKDFGLKDQINRSSGSIMDNIAEGFGRKGNLEFINFLTYSGGSPVNVNRSLIGHMTEIISPKKREKNYLILRTK